MHPNAYIFHMVYAMLPEYKCIYMSMYMNKMAYMLEIQCIAQNVNGNTESEGKKRKTQEGDAYTHLHKYMHTLRHTHAHAECVCAYVYGVHVWQYARTHLIYL